MIEVTNRLDEEILNLKIKIIEHRKRVALINLENTRSMTSYFFYIGWDKCWKKYLYKKVGE